MEAHRRSRWRFYRALDSRHGAGDRVRPAAFTATTTNWRAPLLALWRAAHTRAARRFCLGRLHLSASPRAHPPSAISAPHSMATPLSATDSAWTRAAAQGSACPARGQHGVFIGWRKDTIATIPLDTLHELASTVTPDLLALAEVLARYGTRSANHSIFPAASACPRREHDASSIRVAIPQACVPVVIGA
jgi:hypothetical protein